MAWLKASAFRKPCAAKAGSFPALYRAMIAAGEGAGTLAADYRTAGGNLLERQAEMRGKLIGALAYPAILSLVAILVVMGLMVSVVPRVVEQFDNVDQQLPLITRIVIGISAFLASYWWVLLGLIAVAGLLFWQALKQPAFRLSVDRTILRLPLLGKADPQPSCGANGTHTGDDGCQPAAAARRAATDRRHDP